MCAEVVDDTLKSDDAPELLHAQSDMALKAASQLPLAQLEDGRQLVYSRVRELAKPVDGSEHDAVGPRRGNYPRCERLLKDGECRFRSRSGQQMLFKVARRLSPNRFERGRSVNDLLRRDPREGLSDAEPKPKANEGMATRYEAERARRAEEVDALADRHDKVGAPIGEDAPSASNPVGLRMEHPCAFNEWPERTIEMELPVHKR
jgi:hypothetical protein